jgi:hypothetical protein
LVSSRGQEVQSGVELGLPGVGAAAHAHGAVDACLGLRPCVGGVDLAPQLRPAAGEAVECAALVLDAPVGGNGRGWRCRAADALAADELEHGAQGALGLRSDLDDANAKAASQSEQVATDSDALSKQIDELTAAVADTSDRLDQAIADGKAGLDALNQQASDAGANADALRQKAADAQQNAGDAVAGLETRVDDLAAQIKAKLAELKAAAEPGETEADAAQATATAEAAETAESAEAAGTEAAKTAEPEPAETAADDPAEPAKKADPTDEG